MGKKAVVLLSGGVDSTTCLAIAGEEGYEVYSISFRYGQRHIRELDMARKQAGLLQVKKHIVVDFDMRTIGGSALTDDINVPKGDDVETDPSAIPVTYVPARNTIFLSFALAWAEVIGAEDIFIGANQVDYSGYPDCRISFIHAFEEMANLATRAAVENQVKVKIHTPLMDMKKGEIIARGTDLGVNYAFTHSCYDPARGDIACGQCASCLLRLKGFKEAGLEDPIEYVLPG